MKTDDLVDLLARGTLDTDPDRVARSLVLASAAGLVATVAAMLLLLGPRPDLATAMSLPMFWMKLAIPLLVAAAATVAVARLARPGMRARGAAAAIAAIALVLWTTAGVDLLGAPAGARLVRVTGLSALPCVVSIAVLSIPLCVALFVAMRRLAPTRLRAAGAAAGGLAGALAAVVYAWHCNEMTIPFLAAWYVAGMAIPAVVGALLGHRLLRWA